MKRLLSCYILFWVSIGLFSQDNQTETKADSLFALGNECYSQRKYEDAIRLVTRGLDIYASLFGKENANYTSHLNDLAFYYFLSGNTKEAIRLGEEAIKISKKILANNNPNYAMSLNNLAQYNACAGNYAEAIRLETEALSICQRVFGPNHPNYATCLDNLAQYNAYSGNYVEAIRFGIKALETRKKFFGTNNPMYIISLNNLAKYNSSAGNYAEAVRLGTEALNICKKTLGTEHSYYLMSLNNLAQYNFQLSNFAEAIRLGTEVVEICRKNFGTNNADYALALNNLALFNSSVGNYSQAIQFGQKALEINKKIFGIDHPNYAQCLNNLALYNAYLSNYGEAIRLETKALEILKKKIGSNNIDYATFLNNLAQYNANLGNYTEALHLGVEVLNICKKVFGLEHPNYARFLNNLAQYNANLGNYNEAICLETRTLEIYKKQFGVNHPTYMLALNNLAQYNSLMGKYPEALRLGIEAVNICKRTLGVEHPNYATCLNNLAQYYSLLGNYTEAIRLDTETLKIRKKFLGLEHPDYAMSLNNLAFDFASLGNYDKAIKLMTDALKIYKDSLSREHINYALILNNLSSCYSKSGNHTEAIRFATEALEIRKKILGLEHPDYAMSLNNLSFDFASLGNCDKAIQLSSEALNIYEKVLGKNHPDYISALINLSAYNWKNKNLEITEYSRSATLLSVPIIKNAFANLPSIERSLFWEKYKFWFDNAIHVFAYDFSSEVLNINGYDGVLLSKGLLLNSERELNTLLKESGDKEAEKIYNELRILRLQLNKLYEKPIAERALDTDSLERVAQDLERELVQRSKVYGDFTKNLAISWKQVQQKLGDKDLAVEFVSFPVRNDSVMYAAYCLRKGMEAPKMYPLFEKKQLESLDRTNLYDSTAIGELVWQPLEKELQGVNNVYFAPVGELYNIAIESVPYWKGYKWMSDQWNFYRLSSTRELALTKDEKSVNEAVLYGGLEYDTNVTTMVNNSQKYAVRSHSTDFSLYNLADSLNLRKGVAFLPESKVEAEAINAYMRQTTIRPTLFTDTIGTETSFKALTGKRIKIVHIATHGFYWTESEAKGLNDMLSFLSIDNNRNRYVEDKALMRSGLLFAGANNALVGKQLPKDVDDGILTAQEIANLDLRGLDIVVLSACQTGLGEITGDGVFGLQRGFKKAGANTLLMSLWNVHDDATRLLMTQFYENLIAGKGKAESLREAQQYVRNYEIEKEITQSEGKRPLSALAREQAQKNKNNRIVKKIRPYQSPKYWAAFILLDAIDSSISTPIDEYSN